MLGKPNLDKLNRSTQHHDTAFLLVALQWTMRLKVYDFSQRNSVRWTRQTPTNRLHHLLSSQLSFTATHQRQIWYVLGMVKKLPIANAPYFPVSATKIQILASRSIFLLTVAFCARTRVSVFNDDPRNSTTRHFVCSCAFISLQAARRRSHYSFRNGLNKGSSNFCCCT